MIHTQNKRKVVVAPARVISAYGSPVMRVVLHKLGNRIQFTRVRQKLGSACTLGGKSTDIRVRDHIQLDDAKTRKRLEKNLEKQKVTNAWTFLFDVNK